MKKITVLISIAAALLYIGCSHTNELAKYNLNSKRVIFQNNVSADAARIQFVDETPAPKEKEKKDLVSVLASVGSDILSETSKIKIADAVSTDSVANYVSEGLANALVTFLNVTPVASINDNPDFVVETTIEACQLVTGTHGVKIRVHASSRIIDRNSGNIVWDDSETQTVPVQRNDGYDSNNSSTMNKVFTAVQLSSLSEKEIQKIVDDAAKNAGRLMGETLREDAADANKK